MKSKSMKELCCFCKYLESYLESVAPRESTIKHKCKLLDKRIEWGETCTTGKFEKKTE